MFRDEIKIEKKKKKERLKKEEKIKTRKKQRGQPEVLYAKAWASVAMKRIKRDLRKEIKWPKDRNALKGSRRYVLWSRAKWYIANKNLKKRLIWPFPCSSLIHLLH